MKNFTLPVVLLYISIFFYMLENQITDGGAANRWDYDGPLSPDRWYLVYPQCAGRQQSPVDIDTDTVIYNRLLPPLRFLGYSNIRNVRTSLQNNGHTVEVDLTGRPILIAGGGLPGVYRVQQFHFHWGANDRRGSEHAINGYHYPMEMHIVHYNRRYRTYQEAQSRSDGLAVLAFFFRVGRYNPNFDEIISHLDEIRFRGDEIPLESFPLSSLLPSNVRDFYRYQGSLTTPPCYESVVWTIFKTPVDISEIQLNQFRFLVNENYPNQTNDKVSDDFRPVQPLYGRRICSSDPSDYRLSYRRTRYPHYISSNAKRLNVPMRSMPSYLRRRNNIRRMKG